MLVHTTYNTDILILSACNRRIQNGQRRFFMNTTKDNSTILFCDYYKQWITVYKLDAGFTSPEC